MPLHCPPAPLHLEVAADAVGSDPRRCGPASPATAASSEATCSVERSWDDLQALLDRASVLDPGAQSDAAEWAAVAEGAARTTRRLACYGALRGNLVVSVEDPPVVVGRLLAAASRPARDLYAASSTGRSVWESNTTADA